MILRAALYARVSTPDQTTDGQLHQLRDYAARMGWSAVEYIDEGISGTKAKRPALDALLEAVHRRGVDALVCTKLDRLGRSVGHLCDVAEALQAAGVRLIVLDQSIDSSTAAGRLLFNVLASIAEFERELIRERVVAGIARARRAGKRLGRPARLDREGVARAKRMRRNGRSLREIAKVLAVDKRTVGRALSAARST